MRIDNIQRTACRALLILAIAVSTLPAAAVPAIQILTQPQSQVVDAGTTATFFVEAISPNNILYEWRKDGQPINGANGPTLIIPNATEADEGEYDCLLRITDYELPTDIATLTVNNDSQPLDLGFQRMFPAMLQPWNFEEPQDMAIHCDGIVYVVNKASALIKKFTTDGVFISQWGVKGSLPGQFMAPTAIALDSQGAVYISDTALFGNTVQKFDGDGAFIHGFGGTGTALGQFKFPATLAVDAFDNVYVVDRDNARIQKFDSDGQFITAWGGPGDAAGQFDFSIDAKKRPGIVTDGVSAVFIADTDNHRIQKFALDGTFLGQWGGYGYEDDELDTPTAIALSPDGKLYVSDMGNYRIKIFELDGTPVDTIWELPAPIGLAIDCEGNFYGTGDEEHDLTKYNPNGSRINTWSNRGGGEGEFRTPMDVATAPNGDFFVADFGNSRVQHFNALGQFLDQFYVASPSGIAATDTEVFVSSRTQNKVVVHSHDGQFQRQWGQLGSGSGDFNWPQGIVISGNAPGGQSTGGGGHGIVYVVDAKNHRVQAFTGSGAFLYSFGGFGNQPGKFSSPQYIAADGEGNLLVTDGANGRVQKFDGGGGFLSSFGGFGLGPGKFLLPTGVAVSPGNAIYVADSILHRIQKFGADGTFLGESGGPGAGPGQLRTPSGMSSDEDGRLFVADLGNHRLQVLEDQGVFANTKAIVLAGGGPYEGNNLWNATQSAATFAYRTLRHRGFNKERIRYLSHDTDLDLDANGIADDVFGTASNAQLQDAILNWAADAENLVLYLVDHGGVNTFRMSETEILDAAALQAWLDLLQSVIPGRCTVIYDACESGTFQAALQPPPGVERVVLTSTSPGEPAYFLNFGTISFSSFFWTQTFVGDDVRDSFLFAEQAIGQTVSVQQPLVNTDGDGTSNEPVEDIDALTGFFIGNAADLLEGQPEIGSVSATPVVGGSATLSALDVTDPEGIARVWAVIHGPGAFPGSSSNPVQNMPQVDLHRVGYSDDYSADFSEFTAAGTYNIAIYALDGHLNISAPSQLIVNVGDPQHRRAVILAGGSPSDPLWPAFENSYSFAYTALRTQGIPDEDIFVMAHTTAVPTIVQPPSLGNLQYALGAWAGNDTQHLTLYMVGPGGPGIFEVSPTETLDAALLSTMLDDLQGRLGGVLTVVYEACGAGSFIPPLAPPPGTDRIVIASTGADDSTRLLLDGQLSFSRFFFTRVLNGSSVEEAFDYAQPSIFFAGGGQEAEMDDSGNGVPNEASDGLLARNHYLGAGIGLAGDEPLINSVIGDQVLDGEVSAPLWVENITATGAINQVWAVITPPDYDPGICAPITPTVLLTPVGGGRYEGSYGGFTQAGDYAVTFHAQDVGGNVSPGLERTVTQLQTLDDTPPVVSNFVPALGSVNVPQQPNINFDLTDAGSGVDINTIKIKVNALPLTQSVGVTGSPSNFHVSFVPAVPLALTQNVIVTVDAKDLDGNTMPTYLTFFFVTGVPSSDPPPPGAEPDSFEVDDDAPFANTFTPGAAPQTHNFHDVGDQDWLIFYAAETQIYTFVTTPLGAAATPQVALFAGDGHSNLGLPAGGAISNWAAPASGFYYVRIINGTSAAGNDTGYDFQIINETGGFSIVADAGPNQTRQVGERASFDGSGSFDPDDPTFQVGSYNWTIQSRPFGSASALSNSTEVNPTMIPDRSGTYTIGLVVTDKNGIFSDGDATQTITVAPALGSNRYVAKTKTAPGPGIGSEANPFLTILDGAISVSDAGDVIIATGNYNELLRLGEGALNKQMRLVANGGPVVIGSDVAVESGSGGILPASSDDGTLSSLLTTLYSNMGASSANSTWGSEGAAADGGLYEAALPATPAEAGTLLAQPDSVLSIRLRSETPIDPESIWAPITSNEATDISVTWQPVSGDDLTDIWVIVQPQETWFLNDVIEVTANGGAAEAASRQFVVGDAADSGEAVAQPVAGVDYDGAALGDADSEVTVATNGPEEGMRILPERPYAAPQRVWLPLPTGVDGDAVRLYYYLASGEAAGWHPGEDIAGWLVPDSTVLLEADGVTYLGFKVNHAGMVRLGVVE